MGGGSITGAGFMLDRTRSDDCFQFPQKTRRRGGVQRPRFGGHEPAAVHAGPSCNLERFLVATTPSVDAQYLSKTTMSCWRTCIVEHYPYFELADLWESFREWSVYGTGVNLVLDAGASVVQYYVPYLSGIQLYGEHRRTPAVNSRKAGHDSDGYYSGDSSSDDSTDSELETITRYPKELSQYHPFDICDPRANGLPFEKRTAPSESFSSDDSEAGRTQGHLLFEFFERDLPCSRVPLVNKISDLIGKFPRLKTLRSCDLLPASWMSVAWYPIYRIPTGPTLRDLDACFLTFHSLATPLEGSLGSTGPVITFPHGRGDDGNPKISLPVFGLATYKFNGSMWAQNTDFPTKLPDSLQQAANNWLRLLQVDLPDYQFFISNGMYRR